MKVLLSIKPEFAEKILNGTKRYEFRKVAFKNQNVVGVVIYATQPVGMVIGEFSIEGIMTDSPDRIWQATAQHAGISSDFFNAYYAGCNKAVAIKIGESERYKQPIGLVDFWPGIAPPQSFRYLPPSTQLARSARQLPQL